MGFGSGGGGFTPSPNNVPGSTETGTLLTDTHQFTGSVDITGSLTLNGSSVTGGGGGGGGAVSSYTNSGDNRVITSVNSNTINGEANFTFDGSNMVMSDDTDAKANIGRAVVGYNGSRADAANFAHRDHVSDTAYALQQRSTGETVLNAPTGQNVSMRINGTNALVVAGAAGGNVGINTGSPAARLHVSASSVENDVLRVDGVGTKENALYVSGSGRVGIGTGTPDSTLEIRSTTTQQKWSYDDDHEFTVTVGSNGETVLAVSGTTIAGLGASDLALDVSSGGDIFFRRDGDRLRFGISTGDTFIQADNQDTDIAFRIHPDAGLGAIGTEVFRVDASGAGALLMSGTISNPGGNAPINFRDTATSIHSPGANRLALTAPTLEVTGTLGLNGTSLTSTAAELNLLDASNGSPSAGAWAAVERVGVYTISGAKAGSSIAGGGTNHVLGTLPAGAYVTEAYLDVTSVFAVAGGAVAISLGTATTYPAASRPFLEVCQPSAIPRTGGTIDATSATGVITLSAGSGFTPDLFPGAKLPAQENVILNVADGGGGTDGLTASGATLILKYIVM